MAESACLSRRRSGVQIPSGPPNYNGGIILQLLTKEIEARLPRLGSTENIPEQEKVVQVKFFSPYSNWTWYAVEGEPLMNEETGYKTNFMFFGLVQGFEREWGYFSLNELESARKGPLPLVERDLYFTPVTIKELGI